MAVHITAHHQHRPHLYALEGALIRADPDRHLRPGGLGIRIVGSAQHGDENLSGVQLSGARVDHQDGLAGVIHEQLLAGRVRYYLAPLGERWLSNTQFLERVCVNIEISAIDRYDCEFVPTLACIYTLRPRQHGTENFSPTTFVATKPKRYNPRNYEQNMHVR